MEDIREIHMARGWRDIGYHYVIEDDGSIVPGRPLDLAGAHARGWNARSIGICYTGGGMSKDGSRPISGPNIYQDLGLRNLILAQKMVFPSIKIVKGHRDTGSNKDCPCFNVATWMATGIIQVSRNLA